MNRNVAILIGILILCGIGAYFLTRKLPQTSSNQVPAVSQDKSVNADKKTTEGTLKSLLLSGKPQKCTYSAVTDSVSVTGVVYVANSNLRGDYFSASGEMKTGGHVIVSGQYSYVWTDNSKQGFKVAVDLQQEQLSGTSSADKVDSQTLDLSQKLNYSCQNWTVNESVFVPPSDITFSALTLPSASPSGITVPATEDGSSACLVCDSLPAGSTRDTCKTQLNCQ